MVDELGHTKNEKLDSQKKPGKPQSISWLYRSLSDNETIYAVGEVNSEGQNAQDCCWWHEHPGMFVKWHRGLGGSARDQLLCVEFVRMPLRRAKYVNYTVHSSADRHRHVVQAYESFARSVMSHLHSPGQYDVCSARCDWPFISETAGHGLPLSVHHSCAHAYSSPRLIRAYDSRATQLLPQ
jgi:hypothetical protein